MYMNAYVDEIWVTICIAVCITYVCKYIWVYLCVYGCKLIVIACNSIFFKFILAFCLLKINYFRHYSNISWWQEVECNGEAQRHICNRCIELFGFNSRDGFSKMDDFLLIVFTLTFRHNANIIVPVIKENHDVKQKYNFLVIR